MPLLLTAAGPGAPGEIVPLDPPGPVENLILDGVPTTTGAGVAWDAPASGGTVAEYLVHVQVAGGSWTSLVVNGTVGSLSAVLAGLSENTMYDVRVRAEGPGGNSAWVTEEDLVLTRPAAPVITGITQGDTELTIEWTPGAGLTYKAFVNDEDNFGSATLDASGLTSGEHTFDGLTNDTEYFVWLVAVNATGDSEESASESGTPEGGGGGGVTLVGYSVKTYNDSSLAKPGTIQEGDFLVTCFTEYYDLPPPTGWTRLELTPGGNTPVSFYNCQGFYRFATADDVAAANYDSVFGQYAQGHLLALRGIASVAAQGNWTSFTSASTAFPVADLNAGPGVLLALMFVDSYQAGGGPGNVIDHPAGFVEIVPGNTYGGWPVAIKEAGSSSGTLTWTTSNNSYAGILLALLTPATP